jgi:hypothetical protein
MMVLWAEKQPGRGEVALLEELGLPALSWKLKLWAVKDWAFSIAKSLCFK